MVDSLSDSSGFNQHSLLNGSSVIARQQLEAGLDPNIVLPNNQSIIVGANYDLTKLLLEFGASHLDQALAAAEQNHSLRPDERSGLLALLTSAKENWEKIGYPRALLLSEERNKLHTGEIKKIDISKFNPLNPPISRSLKLSSAPEMSLTKQSISNYTLDGFH